MQYIWIWDERSCYQSSSAVSCSCQSIGINEKCCVYIDQWSNDHAWTWIHGYWCGNVESRSLVSPSLTIKLWNKNDWYFLWSVRRSTQRWKSFGKFIKLFVTLFVDQTTLSRMIDSQCPLCKYKYYIMIVSWFFTVYFTVTNN